MAALSTDAGALAQQLRADIAHSLASPIRGLGILADLLAETAQAGEPDLDVVREVSRQLTVLVGDANQRLTEFSEHDDGR